MSKVFIEDEHKNILANANEEPFIIDQVGTDVFVNGQRQDRLDFTSDPQEQLDAKQDKLSQAQLQAIGEVDAVKSIALQNQSDVTELSSSVLANTKRINGIELDTTSPTFEFKMNPYECMIIVTKTARSLEINGEQKASIVSGVNVMFRYSNSTEIDLNDREIKDIPLDATFKVVGYCPYLKINKGV